MYKRFAHHSINLRFSTWVISELLVLKCMSSGPGFLRNYGDDFLGPIFGASAISTCLTMLTCAKSANKPVYKKILRNDIVGLIPPVTYGVGYEFWQKHTHSKGYDPYDFLACFLGATAYLGITQTPYLIQAIRNRRNNVPPTLSA